MATPHFSPHFAPHPMPHVTPHPAPHPLVYPMHPVFWAHSHQTFVVPADVERPDRDDSAPAWAAAIFCAILLVGALCAWAMSDR